jgi:hypothetical protein
LAIAIDDRRTVQRVQYNRTRIHDRHSLKGPMSESTNTAARERLEALIGEWTMEAKPPGGPAWPGEGRVQRIYEMSLDGGVWKPWRHGEPFSQRFTGNFSDDGRTIAGRWETAGDGKDWKTDFDLTYTKVE